ncbi:citrate (pro-3S)-lyase subunit beta [Enterococcus faecalis]|jgi:citrate lyase subunit beta/citryl-CoA lyase|uniref:citrate (pro-3S)-lyase subunit beta n=1 Tax=Enterococcus faecalis TaxID=1351 RepID=UPI00032EF5C1|nr:citrate (pro-3S)-lyase subunit beta [Enterococcus faecalis]EGO7920173.1 citrate (pro-3S)-lyase subunit beta [Enterococcus faecalis]EHK9493802.1 citrate (pro-3S)-lyase subunit beta [Enterococcus faecalis]EIY5980447.1 citrate (pro-3S)-lyase subunit beta [Enterococcus faecalis]EKG8980704.1 citrate (pro-3S)-lyase subunit beta [Enterococcus faecalis]EME3187445.1 citrate (pro-3S)-lyase subunit beta [Enterococcus faecalis]
MERLRRTMMFVPGANAAMLRDAPLYGADSIMFDLEDAVSLKEKDSARVLVHSALKTFDYGNIEIVVRINALDAGGAEDIEAMVLADVDVIRLPKTETAQDIIDVEAVITEVEQQNDIPVGTTKMMAAIESAEGVLNAPAIAKSSTRLIGIALGAEDYVTNMKTRRHPDGQELFFARSMILHAARAAGIAAIDTVYSDVDNTEGFEAEVRLIKQLGFDGKSVINPRQIPLVNTIYAPTEKEIQNAKEVIWGIREAEAKGSGVISVNGKMVDKPIVERAERVIALALAAKLITEEEI